MSKCLVSAIRDKKVLELARKGETPDDIAKALNYSASHVRRVIKQLMSPEEHKLYKANNREKQTAIQRRYTLWDGRKISFNKAMPAGNRSFRLRCNGQDINVGNFHDWVSIEIIHDLINEFIE